MTTVNVGPGKTFTVINSTTIEFDDGNGVKRYENVSAITYPDGTVKTCSDLINEAGGATYVPGELRRCVKVEGYDPDANNRQVFTLYSTNSSRANKGFTQQIEGGAWAEMFSFAGDHTTNHILKMWKDYFDTIGVDYTGVYNPDWIGFKIGYGIQEAHNYVMTWVNDFLEESIPCPPAEIGVTVMHCAKAVGRFQPPATLSAGGINHYYVPIRRFRLYRAVATSNGQAIYLRVPLEPTSVVPNALAAGLAMPHDAGNANLIYGFQFIDTVTNDKLVDPLTSAELDPPPPRELLGLTDYRNGMKAAFWKNELRFCEPNKPYAWPDAYRFPLPVDAIVRLIADENDLIVITTKEPYRFVGVHPQRMSYEKLAGSIQAGIRPNANLGGFIAPSRAATRTPDGVVYASREGPVMVAGGRAQLIAEGLFTADDWQGFYAQYFPFMRLAYHDRRVLGYLSGQTVAGFLLDVSNPADPQFTRYLPTNPFVGDARLMQTDSLYVITQSGATGAVARFADSGANRQACSWWSRDVNVPKPANFGALQIIGYFGSVNVEVKANDVTVWAGTIVLPSTYIDAAPIQRLPGGFKARRWSVKMQITGNALVREALLASTPQELERA